MKNNRVGILRQKIIDLENVIKQKDIKIQRLQDKIKFFQDCTEKYKEKILKTLEERDGE